MTTMTPLDSILSFVGLLQKFKTIERHILTHGSERRENDTEHSFTLAMLGWYLNQAYSLGLDQEKIFAYALAHDLVEIYAGDTFFYESDQDHVKGKHEREAEAAIRLKKEFPEFGELHATIEAYEERADRESRFVYALDKVEPVLNIYLDGGRTWRADKVTLEMLASMKLSKVAADPAVEKIFKELVERLRAEEAGLFGTGQ